MGRGLETADTSHLPSGSGNPIFLQYQTEPGDLAKSHCAEPFHWELYPILIWWKSISEIIPSSTRSTAGQGALQLIPLLQFLRDKGRASHFLKARPNRAGLSSQGCREQHVSCIPFTAIPAIFRRQKKEDPGNNMSTAFPLLLPTVFQRICPQMPLLNLLRTTQ